MNKVIWKTKNRTYLDENTPYINKVDNREDKLVKSDYNIVLGYCEQITPVTGGYVLGRFGAVKEIHNRKMTYVISDLYTGLRVYPQSNLKGDIQNLDKLSIVLKELQHIYGHDSLTNAYSDDKSNSIYMNNARKFINTLISEVVYG